MFILTHTSSLCKTVRSQTLNVVFCGLACHRGTRDPSFPRTMNMSGGLAPAGTLPGNLLVFQKGLKNK